jgi:alpha-tubulin suppressor-like RCC1 family protein
MISVNALITKINDLIAEGSLSELEVSQLAKAVDTLERKGIGRVGSLSEIAAENNTGRIVLVESEFKYYISDGTEWLTNIQFFKTVDLTTPMYAWGSNSSGRLGDGTAITRRSPVSVIGGFTDWIEASAGGGHSVAVRANGTVWAWGSNSNGRLGDGTIITRSSPVSVVGGFTDWISASAGSFHSVAVRANGTVWAWGYNSSGQLGNGTTTDRSSPVSVVGGFSDWISASTGQAHSVAVRANGTVWAWGSNNIIEFLIGGGQSVIPTGQLGNGTITDRSSPVLVVGGFTDWVQVSGGSYHSLGVRANGTVWAWGYNGSGQLGDGTLISRSSPVSVVGGFTDWISASGGSSHSVAVRANGTVWAWGFNYSGRLGDGTIINRSSPVSVVGGFTDWISASAGSFHSLGVRANGTVWAWGRNSNGYLGDDTITSRSSPVSVVGGFTDWISASAGNAHSLGVRA